MNHIEKAAKQIRETNERIYVPRHEYRSVEARSFRHLDLQFYDQVRDQLVARGSMWLGDVENVTLKGTAGDFRTFIRMLASEDRTVCIGLYHLKPRFWMRILLWILRVKIGKSMDCETEFSDGGYVVTSNAVEAGKLNPPPRFDMVFLPFETDHETVLQVHCQRVKSYLATNPAVRATTINTSQTALDMQHRIEVAKAAFRKGVGYVTADELERMGAKPQEAAAIKEAMDRSKGEN